MKKIKSQNFISWLLFALFLLTGATVFITPAHAFSGKAEEKIEYGMEDVLYRKIRSERMAQGVTYQLHSRFTEAGWTDYHVLQVDLSAPHLKLQGLRSAEWKKKETLRDLAAAGEQTVWGAINASYFATEGEYSESQGLEYQSGWVHADALLRPLLLDLGGAVVLDAAEGLVLSVEGSDERWQVERINNLPSEDGVAIYNAKADADSAVLDRQGAFYKAVLRDHKVQKLVLPYQPMTFSESVLVFSERNTALRNALTLGKTVQLHTSRGRSLQDLRLAIPGASVLLRSGLRESEGDFVQPNHRHPRTAIALDELGSTLFFVVADGRGRSIGAKEEELLLFLKELGAWDAIAMDGGASSVLLARSRGADSLRIRNALPNQFERKLINGVAVVSTAQPGELRELFISAEKEMTFADQPIRLTVRGADQNGLPVAISEQELVWSVSGAEGLIRDSVFLGKKPGKADITVYYRDFSAYTAITVTGNPVDLKVSPALLRANKEASFRITGIDEHGFTGPIAAADAKYQLEDETIGYFAEGIFYPSRKGGFSRVTITAGQRSATAYVFAGEGREEELAEILKNLPKAYQEYPLDPLRKEGQKDPDIRLFGTTAGRNRLLDEVLLQKVEEELGKAEYAIFAGENKPIDATASEIETADTGKKYYRRNQFDIIKKNGVAIISLASKGESFKDADGTQFYRLAEELRNISENNILILSEIHPLKTETPEGAIIHELISGYASRSGKTVYYIAATGYDTEVQRKDGIRYIQTNGLWYKIKDKRELDLSRSFHTVTFKREKGVLTYDIKELYPLVE